MPGDGGDSFNMGYVGELDDGVGVDEEGEGWGRVWEGCTEDELFRGPVEGDKVRWERIGRAARDDGAVGEEEEGATGD